ncbi:MAG: ribonuclease P protein component [Bacteroidales bacterium]|nr:ribonuclease P protein component [Bacteroidales bacterium]
MTFAFPKEQRLRQRDTLAALPAKGKVLFKYPFKAYVLLGGASVSRYAVAVPKKSFKRAVKRNLLKRRTREALRLNQTECLGSFCGDYLFVYIAKDICEYSAIEAAVCDILSKSKAL